LADNQGSPARLSPYEWALALFATTVVLGGTAVGLLSASHPSVIGSVLFFGVPIYFVLLALFIWRERRRAP